MRVAAHGGRLPRPGRAGLRRTGWPWWTSPACRAPRHAHLRASSRPGPGAWPWPSTPWASARGAGGHREPELGPVPDRLLRGQRLRPRRSCPINFRLNADEIAYIVEHSGASVLLYDPDLADEVDTIKVAAPRSASTEPTTPSSSRRRRDGRGAGGLGGRRGRHLLDQLHLGHHGPAQGRAAHPPQLLAERRHLRVAHRRQRPRRAPAHPAHVPLQRLGDALRGDGHGRHATSCCARSTARRSCRGSSARA